MEAETVPFEKIELTDEEVERITAEINQKNNLNSRYFANGFETAIQYGDDPSLDPQERLNYAKEILAEHYMHYPYEVGWAVGVLYHRYLDSFLNRR